MKASGPFDLSKNPEKAKIRLSDVNCLVCGCTLFIDSCNPCSACQYAWNDKRDNCSYCPLKENNH